MAQISANAVRVAAANALSTMGTLYRPAALTTSATTAGPTTPPTNELNSAHDVMWGWPPNLVPIQSRPVGKIGPAAKPATT
jgi:hypothetical protein